MVVDDGICPDRSFGGIKVKIYCPSFKFGFYSIDLIQGFAVARYWIDQDKIPFFRHRIFSRKLGIFFNTFRKSFWIMR